MKYTSGLIPAQWQTMDIYIEALQMQWELLMHPLVIAFPAFDVGVVVLDTQSENEQLWCTSQA